MIYKNSTRQAIMNFLNNIHCLHIIAMNNNTYFVTFLNELIMIINRDKNSFNEILKEFKWTKKQLNFIYNSINLFMDDYYNCYFCKWKYDNFYGQYVPFCYTESEAREAGLIV